MHMLLRVVAKRDARARATGDGPALCKGSGGMSSTGRTLLIVVAAAVAFCAYSRAQTADWPQRPLRIVIPTTPGGSPDLVARRLGGKLTERLGQPVSVESITQGVGLLANQIVSRSAP